VRTENSTTEAGGVLTTTYYSAGLADNTTSLEQAFAFYDRPTEGQFNSTRFTIGANSLKWSVNLTVSTATNNTDDPYNSTMSDPASALTIRYRLAALSSSVSASLSRNGQVLRRGGEPQEGMTTYYVPLLDDASTASSSHSSSLLVAKVEVLDLALVDGQWVPLLGHDVVLANSSGNLPEYVLVLEFAPFNHSLFYDPSVSLGVLLSSDGGPSDTSSDLALIVATSVVIPLAVLCVVVVAVAGVALLARRKTRARKDLQRRLVQLHSDV
jgi:hypothetical protein